METSLEVLCIRIMTILRFLGRNLHPSAGFWTSKVHAFWPHITSMTQNGSALPPGTGTVGTWLDSNYLVKSSLNSGVICVINDITIIRRVTMLRTKSGAGPCRARFSEVRAKSHYFLFFRPGPGKVWGKFLAGTKHDFLSNFQKSGQNGFA